MNVDEKEILGSDNRLKKLKNPTKDYAKICKMYSEGYDILTISKQCDCSYPTIYKALQQNNIDTRAKEREIPPSVLDKIKSMYQQCNSILHISKSMGYNYERVWKIIKKSDLKPISSAKMHNPNLQEDYFARIDTAEKAYWLGWFITDGSVTTKTHISITIHKDDVRILELLQADLGLENKIKPFNEKYMRFLFSCKRMAEDLAKYGVVMNKTFTVGLPNLDKELIPHLLRGCFEGDGGISKSFRKKRNRYEYELSFTCNKMCVEAFNRHLSALIGKPEHNLNKNNSVWRVRWTSKEDIRAILNVLYQDCGEHYLERKRKFINEI